MSAVTVAGRPHVICLMLLISWGLTGWPATAVGSPTRPNVLLVLTDDQGYGDFSIHGNPHLQTPHIDQLATQGVQFNRFYVNSFCAPTRAALLTGRWPLRTGVFGVTHNKEAMRTSEVTLAEALGGAGYRTGCFGKWHNGEQYPFTPPAQGFQEFFGFHNGHFNNYFNATLLRGARPEPTRGFITDVLTDEALRFIEKSHDKPFFCYVAYNAPHAPFQVPDKYFDKFQAAGLEDKVAAFFGMCENIDDNVGRLLAKLDELRLAENTIVLFLTDNGGTAGVPIYNAGMRGGKTSMHEGGTRVPLFIRWPAAHWTPHVVRPLAEHTDLYPTLLDLCEVAAPPGPRVDGRSLRPLLESHDPAWGERVLFTHNPIDETNKFPGAVRTEQYRLVRSSKGRMSESAGRNGDADGPAWMLFDMQNDPGESHDLARDMPDTVRQLSGLYDRWYADISSAGRERFRLPVGHVEENPVVLNAPQSFHKNLAFANGPGWAHDWLTGWTSLEGEVWFEIDVARPGDYEIELAYACAAADAGSILRVTLGGETREVNVPAAPPRPIALPHRDAEGQSRYRDRDWARLPVGVFRLPAGPASLQLKAAAKPGMEVLDLKHAQFTRRDAARPE